MTFTELWKNGELESGWYYIEEINGDVQIDYYDVACVDYEFNELEGDWDNFGETIKEVLAPVPSYEEWQELHKRLKDTQNLELKVRKENQQLEEKLEKAEATLLDIDGGWVTDEIRSKISEYFVYAIGEK